MVRENLLAGRAPLAGLSARLLYCLLFAVLKGIFAWLYRFTIEYK
jgi:hypothetical protein